MIINYNNRAKYKFYRNSKKQNDEYLWKQQVRFEAIKQKNIKNLSLGY